MYIIPTYLLVLTISYAIIFTREMKKMSIIQSKKECYICHKQFSLHKHHVFFGRGNRAISEKNGFTVYLCAEHHNIGNVCAHNCKEMDLMIKRACQRKYEETHTRENFIALVGKNYLEE